MIATQPSSSHSQSLPLTALRAHPDNPNRLHDRTRRTLARHLERAGRCPPLIVRPHPRESGAYQIIDGHHRAAIARELGWTEIDAVVWHASDAETRLLLATLNRLHGEDDPLARARLMAELDGAFDPRTLASLVPETPSELRALEKLLQPPPVPDAKHEMSSDDESLEALVVFLPRALKRRVERALRAIDRNDPARALLTLIDQSASEPRSVETTAS